MVKKRINKREEPETRVYNTTDFNMLFDVEDSQKSDENEETYIKRHLKNFGKYSVETKIKNNTILYYTIKRLG